MLRSLLVFVLIAGLSLPAECQESPKPSKPPVKVAGVASVYHYNSHADVIIGRTLQGYSLLDKGPRPNLQLMSLFTDQVPKNDTSRAASKKYGVPIYESVREALTLGGDKLAVDGVLFVIEHGTYGNSETGAKQFPKRRLFEQVANVFEKSGRSVPVFSDKHLSDNWKDAKWIYDRAQELKVPMMAGSSIPSAWRDPPTDVKRGAKLKEIVAVSYGGIESYGFHGLEMVQSLAERRAGGETGISSCLCLTGDAVWDAARDGKPKAITTEDLKSGKAARMFLYDQSLLEKTLSTLSDRRWEKQKKTVRESVREPVLFVVNYRDGLRASMLILNGAVSEWAAAWRYEDGSTDATCFRYMDGRPYHHFTYLLKGVEKMMETGKPTWPVERTLVTSGVLDALMISKRDGGKLVETPYIDVKYKSDWDWSQPPELPLNPPEPRR
jgi:hypothetical protein